MDTGPTSDVDETFRLAKNEQATSLAASYLRPERVFITQWIELKDVEYTDGSNWHASRAAQCTVTPDNFILVRQ